jgi:hypothetical protein
MISWIQEGEDATARPAAWVAGSGCDVLVLHTGSDEPLSIAAQWNRGSRSDPDAYAAAIDRWLEYFNAEGIPQIAFGCVVLRRRSVAPGGDRENWIRATRMPAARLQAAGTHLEQIFAAHDFLASLEDDRRLLDERLVVNENVALEQELRPTDEGWALRDSSLSLTEGMRFSAGLDDVTTALVYGLCVPTSIREALPHPSGEPIQTPDHSYHRRTWSCIGEGCAVGS